MTEAGNVVPLTRPAPEQRTRPVPPHNIEVEQALLGTLLVRNSALASVVDVVLPEHFSYAVHGRIYAAIVKLVERGAPADPTTLKPLFDQDEVLQELGGAAYLVRLANSPPNLVNGPFYAQTLRDLWVKRELMTLADDIAAAAAREDLDRPPEMIVAEAEERLYAVVEKKGQPARAVTVGNSAKQAVAQTEIAFQRGGGITGVPTGLHDVDQVTGGLHDSDLVILAGRPSMGKTALAGSIAYGAAEAFAREAREKQKKPRVVAFFSLEMSHTQFSQRLMARRTAISEDAQRRGNVDANDIDRLIEAARWFEDFPVVIDDTPAVSVGHIRRHARRLKRKHGLGLIIVDYIQMMRQGTKQENRRLEIGEISAGLKAIAKEFEVPVLALSQLSRQVESREDKRPMLSDLRESGDLEQDADTVMFVFREEYYLSRSEPMRRSDESDDKFNDRYERWHSRLEQMAGLAEVIFAKNRHSPISSVKCAFDGVRSQFLDLAKREVP